MDLLRTHMPTASATHAHYVGVATMSWIYMHQSIIVTFFILQLYITHHQVIVTCKRPSFIGVHETYAATLLAHDPLTSSACPTITPPSTPTHPHTSCSWKFAIYNS